jgi:hypothetical protein
MCTHGVLEDLNIVMFIPQGYRDGPQRITVSKTDKWPAVQAIIYQNVGCDKVAQKPELLWKFEKPRAKTLSLEEESHWDDLKAEVEGEQKKKTPSHIEVLIPEEVMQCSNPQIAITYGHAYSTLLRFM